jgi:hypothetical protein
MPSNATHALVGSAILEALLAFQPSVPVPDYRSPEWKAHQLALFRAAGVKSARQFESGSKAVLIETARKNLHFTPSRNGGSTGPNKGHHFLLERMVETPLGIDPEALGLTLAEVWARCA